jgi:nicotinate dehydrogenase subunit A
MSNKTFVLSVNGQTHELNLPAETPLLYVLRNDLKLKGTRFGCGLGQCGACNVHVDGHCVQSCDTPLWSVAGKQIKTIEGLAVNGTLDCLQQAFIEEQAAQCGYCINGVLMSAKALLDENPTPTLEQIHKKLDRNLCRCGTHVRILRAVQRASKMLTQDGAHSL